MQSNKQKLVRMRMQGVFSLQQLVIAITEEKNFEAKLKQIHKVTWYPHQVTRHL